MKLPVLLLALCCIGNLSAQGLIPTLKNGFWGYSDERHWLVIPAVYSKAEPFEAGFAQVEKNGNPVYIDRSGNEFPVSDTLILHAGPTGFAALRQRENSAHIDFCRPDGSCYYTFTPKRDDPEILSGPNLIAVNYHPKTGKESAILLTNTGDTIETISGELLQMSSLTTNRNLVHYRTDSSYFLLITDKNSHEIIFRIRQGTDPVRAIQMQSLTAHLPSFRISFTDSDTPQFVIRFRQGSRELDEEETHFLKKKYVYETQIDGKRVVCDPSSGEILYTSIEKGEIHTERMRDDYIFSETTPDSTFFILNDRTFSVPMEAALYPSINWHPSYATLKNNAGNQSLALVRFPDRLEPFPLDSASPYVNVTEMTYFNIRDRYSIREGESVIVSPPFLSIRYNKHLFLLSPEHNKRYDFPNGEIDMQYERFFSVKTADSIFWLSYDSLSLLYAGTSDLKLHFAGASANLDTVFYTDATRQTGFFAYYAGKEHLLVTLENGVVHGLMFRGNELIIPIWRNAPSKPEYYSYSWSTGLLSNWLPDGYTANDPLSDIARHTDLLSVNYPNGKPGYLTADFQPVHIKELSREKTGLNHLFSGFYLIGVEKEYWLYLYQKRIHRFSEKPKIETYYGSNQLYISFQTSGEVLSFVQSPGFRDRRFGKKVPLNYEPWVFNGKTAQFDILQHFDELPHPKSDAGLYFCDEAYRYVRSGEFTLNNDDYLLLRKPGDQLPFLFENKYRPDSTSYITPISLTTSREAVYTFRSGQQNYVLNENGDLRGPVPDSLKYVARYGYDYADLFRSKKTGNHFLYNYSDTLIPLNRQLKGDQLEQLSFDQVSFSPSVSAVYCLESEESGELTFTAQGALNSIVLTLEEYDAAEFEFRLIDRRMYYKKTVTEEENFRQEEGIWYDAAGKPFN